MWHVHNSASSGGEVGVLGGGVQGLMGEGKSLDGWLLYQ